MSFATVSGYLPRRGIFVLVFTSQSYLMGRVHELWRRKKACECVCVCVRMDVRTDGDM